jgi:hypothetical protein
MRSAIRYFDQLHSKIGVYRGVLTGLAFTYSEELLHGTGRVSVPVPASRLIRRRTKMRRQGERPNAFV